MWNLIRWVSPRTIKETFVPPTDYRYPFMAPTADGGTRKARYARRLVRQRSTASEGCASLSSGCLMRFVRLCRLVKDFSPLVLAAAESAVPARDARAGLRPGRLSRAMPSAAAFRSSACAASDQRRRLANAVDAGGRVPTHSRPARHGDGVGPAMTFDSAVGTLDGGADRSGVVQCRRSRATSSSGRSRRAGELELRQPAPSRRSGHRRQVAASPSASATTTHSDVMRRREAIALDGLEVVRAAFRRPRRRRRATRDSPSVG